MTKTSFKKLTSIVLAVMMLLSAFVVTFYAADENSEPTGGSTVYFSPGESSSGNPAWFAWTWGEGAGKWTRGDQVGSYIRFDGVDTMMTIVRMPSGSESGNFDTKWDQSENITVKDNLYIFAAWGGSIGANWSVTESHYDGPDVPAQSTGTSATEYTGSARTILFTDNQGWGSVYVHYFGGSSESTWPGIAMMQSGDDGDSHAQFTANVPADSTGLVFTKSISGPQTVNCDISDTDIKGFYTDGTTDSDGHFKAISWGGTIVTEYTEQTDDTQASQYTRPTQPTVVTFPTYTTAPVVTEPFSIPSPTEPTAEDEDTSFYVSAKSNVNTTGSKVKVSDNNILVSYTLKADEKMDDGQFSVSYDAAKLSLNPLYNTASSMFPVAVDASYNLNAASGMIIFNFSAVGGKYDFTEDGKVLINLVFTKIFPNEVGTASVYLNISELSSKDKSYVEESKITDGADVSVSQVIEGTIPQIQTDNTAPTAAENNLTINAKSNIAADVQTKNVTSSNAEVTFSLSAPELISYGDATVTFDSGKLALENRFNTYETMFTTLNSNVSYRLNVSEGMMKFTFTGVSNDQKGIYDFTGGAPLITLMFTVKAGAEGSADVSLNFEQLGSIDKAYVENGAVVDNNAVVSSVIEGENATQSGTDVTIPSIATGVTTEPFTQSTQDTTNSTQSTQDTTAPTQSTQDTQETTKPTQNTESTQPSTQSYQTIVTATAVKTKIYVGKTTKVSASVTNGTGQPRYTTSNSKVATVNAVTGVVTGKSQGTAYIKATNNGASDSVKITVIRRANTLKASAKKLTVKVKAKKTVFKRSKAFRISGAKGKLTFKKKSGIKLVSINKKTGKITVKKGLKKGKTYTIKFNVRAAGDRTYKAKSKNVRVKIKVK